MQTWIDWVYQNFDQICIWWIIAALVVFPFALFITAPYGRHTKKLGLSVPNKLGWVLMEAPVLIIFLLLTFWDNSTLGVDQWVMVGLFSLHYINRSFVWPLRTRTTGKRMPVAIVMSALTFNFFNGTLNGLYVRLGFTGWDVDPWLFALGVVVFLTGMCINMWSDERLLNLRKPGDTNYYIPKGGLFNRISSPNLFGEIIEWTGWAIMGWGLAPLSFAVWTAANLIPRALDHHRWYKKKFEEYPASRKAVIPGLL